MTSDETTGSPGIDCEMDHGPRCPVAQVTGGARTSDPNVGVARRLVMDGKDGLGIDEIANEALDNMESGVPTVIHVRTPSAGHLAVQLIRRHAGHRDIPISFRDMNVWPVGKTPETGIAIAAVTPRFLGGAIPDAPHRADPSTGTSTWVTETPDDLCVVSIFGRVNEIAPGHGVGTTSARFDAEGAREVRDRLNAYLARVEHQASRPLAPQDTNVSTPPRPGRVIETLADKLLRRIYKEANEGSDNAHRRLVTIMKWINDHYVDVAPRCLCRRGPTDSLMHDADCPLAKLDPWISDLNAGAARSSRIVTAFLDRGPDSGQIADEALGALEDGTPTLISVAGPVLRLLMVRILRRRASQRGIEVRYTTSKVWLAQKDSVSIDIVALDDEPVPRWASWITSDKCHVVGLVDIPDGKTDPRLALFELRSRADAMFVVDLLKRVGARPMPVAVEKFRELRIASGAVPADEGEA